MPVRTRLDWKSSVAKLAPVYESIRDEVFLGDERFVFVGPCVRDALFGGLNNHYDIQSNLVQDITIGSMTDLKDKALAKHFAQWAIEGEDNKYQIDTKFGKVTFSLWQQWSPIWQFDSGIFSLPSMNNFDQAQFIAATKSVSLTLSARKSIKRVDQAKGAMTYALDVCAKYGWHIDPESLEFLGKIIERDAPLQEFNETLIGFRAYNINNGYLHGAAQNPWETSTLSVDCPDFREHIKEQISTDGGSSLKEDGSTTSHSCGIYIYKDPAECVHYYGIGKRMDAIAVVVGWGDFWEGERGYRIEHCRIEKLWVFNDTAQLRPYEINGGVIMKATLGDFYKDIYTTDINWQHNKGLR